jgi:hypothetical protein
VKPCGLPIWLSFPATNPPVLGFYGFKNFYTFAKLILELQSKIA